MILWLQCTDRATPTSYVDFIYIPGLGQKLYYLHFQRLDVHMKTAFSKTNSNLNCKIFINGLIKRVFAT